MRFVCIALVFMAVTLSWGQRPVVLKQMRKAAHYEKRIERMEKRDPACVTMLNYFDYEDEVFPNERILKFPNLESVVLIGRPMRTYKRDSIKTAVALRIDTQRVKELQHLKYLTLAQFNLSTFPQEIYAMSNLQGLSIETCLVDSLPPGIHKLSRLKVLHLNLNYLHALPDDFASLDSLEDLGLANNHFRVIPNALSSMKAIANINLGNSNTGHQQSGTEEEWATGSYVWPFPVCANHISWEDDSLILRRLLESPSLQQLELHARQCGDKEVSLRVIGAQALWRKVRWEKPYTCPDPWPDRWFDRPSLANKDLIEKGVCKCSLLYY
ncbi:MAG TPA: hypothetical protein PK760_00185 [Flavobacteriales bacterium]|nr:hypothetical protein [Flavobacteriales bacterium]